MKVISSWQAAFTRTAQQPVHAEPLRDAALREHLGDWTRALTGVAVEVCESLGWQAAAKGHPLDLLPVPHHEYLGLDVLAFAGGAGRWRFPIAAIELENSRDDDRIAYSLWKVLCVRAELRMVFCYRRQPEQGAALVACLRDEVVGALGVNERMALSGETVIVVGSRDEASRFPYGFFKWWLLEKNTGTFQGL